jgi:hypothetical protein
MFFSNASHQVYGESTSVAMHHKPPQMNFVIRSSTTNNNKLPNFWKYIMDLWKVQLEVGFEMLLESKVSWKRHCGVLFQ